MPQHPISDPKMNLESAEKFNSLAYIWLLLFLILGSFSYSKLPLDQNLSPRFTYTSIAILMGSWILLKNKFHPPQWRLGFIDFLLIGYLLWNLLSISWSNNIPEAIFEAQKPLLLGFSFYTTKYFILPQGNNNKFYKILVAICSVGVFYLLGIIIAWALSPENKYGNVYEIVGYSSHKNLCASLSFLLGGISLSLLPYLSKRWKYLAVATLTAGLIAIVVLQTRAVFLGIIAAAIYFTITNASIVISLLKNYTKSILLATLILMVSLSSIVYFSGSFYTLKNNLDITSFSKSKSAMERVAMWDKSIPMVKKYFVNGVGIGNWKIFLPENGIEGLKRAETEYISFVRPHNDFLWILCELGIIGLMLYLGFVLFTLGHSLRAIHYTDPARKNLVAIATSIFIGYLVISFFDFPKERVEHNIYLGILLGLIVAHTHSAVDNKLKITIPHLVLKLTISAIAFTMIATGYYRWKGEEYSRIIIASNSKKQWDKVIENCHHAISPFYNLDPIGNPIVWFEGIAYFNKKETAKAEQLLAEAVKITPYNFKILFSQAQVLAGNQKMEEAVVVLKEVLRLNPKHDDAKIALFKYYSQKRELENAKAIFDKISDDNESKKILQNLFNNNNLSTTPKPIVN